VEGYTGRALLPVLRIGRRALCISVINILEFEDGDYDILRSMQNYGPAAAAAG